ncbi:MAG TPA: MotA/TolQ/ExbB proton channel family protein [Campylobacterales bacterium]|nr:MotA/TolQ/ExbB proton channel family protein [Campylobacterales bacterium]
MQTFIIDNFAHFVGFMNNGGAVMWVLFALNLLLWYGLGYRYIALKRGTMGNVRHLIEKHLKKGDKKRLKGLLDHAAHDAIAAAREARSIGQNCRYYIEDSFSPYRNSVKLYSVLVKTIVVVAPLIGLLGTVIGMIETFEALTSSAMFSQGASISGGVSKALFTTELGLVVAVPGLIIGKILDRKEERFNLEFDQMTDIICTKDLHAL